MLGIRFVDESTETVLFAFRGKRNITIMTTQKKIIKKVTIQFNDVLLARSK